MKSEFMESREVTKTIKNQFGEVVALCNDAELWSPKLRSIAIPEIELKINRYYVKQDENEVEIQIINGSGNKKVLIANADQENKNLLMELPDSD
jgi:hypothetical protein